MLVTKSGVTKVYFAELPKEVQERFHYDAATAAEYSGDKAAAQEAFRKQQGELRQKLTEEKNKYWAERERTTAQRSTRPSQVPFLTAISHETGNWITESGSGVRSIGYGIYVKKSQTTTGILAVNVKLRTPGMPLVEPYEVQCFFTAKDKDQVRYIYDAIKFNSSARFDEINVFARDLFGGTKTTNTSISKNHSRVQRHGAIRIMAL